MDKKVAQLKKQVQAVQAKLKTAAVKESATKTKEVKKELAAAQTAYEVALSRADELRKSMLRPETVGYLQKYHLALPFLADMTEFAPAVASTTDAIPPVAPASVPIEFTTTTIQTIESAAVSL